ncbi:HPP family protein [Streptomyces sp. CG 926]|uniref:HPP family protein n=1 Tax=Streptomyces sp. CG 926 TaxID=1882405 RepID=UPI000D6AA188|nr:HPP family protein [Streptomyces sp. CG 926]PWK74666.1 HPP family protein [Streptomyces sp. CG 926]
MSVDSPITSRERTDDDVAVVDRPGWRAAAGTIGGLGTVMPALLSLAALGAAIHEPVLIPSPAASAAVLHAAPATPAAQPRSVLLGHHVGAATGYAALALGQGGPWTAAAVGAVTFAATGLLRVPHAPACATAVIVILQTPRAAHFVPLLAGAAAILVLVQHLASRVVRGQERYPARWW